MAASPATAGLSAKESEARLAMAQRVRESHRQYASKQRGTPVASLNPGSKWQPPTAPTTATVRPRPQGACHGPWRFTRLPPHPTVRGAVSAIANAGAPRSPRPPARQGRSAQPDGDRGSSSPRSPRSTQPAIRSEVPLGISPPRTGPLQHRCLPLAPLCAVPLSLEPGEQEAPSPSSRRELQRAPLAHDCNQVVVECKAGGHFPAVSFLACSWARGTPVAKQRAVLCAPPRQHQGPRSRPPPAPNQVWANVGPMW